MLFRSALWGGLCSEDLSQRTGGDRGPGCLACVLLQDGVQRGAQGGGASQEQRQLPSPHAGRMPCHHLRFGEAGLGTDGVSAVMQPVPPNPGPAPQRSQAPGWLSWPSPCRVKSAQSSASRRQLFPHPSSDPRLAHRTPWCFNRRCHLVCLGRAK